MAEVQRAAPSARAFLGVEESLSGGASLFDAWNDHVNLALELARWHGTRFVFEAFDAAVRGTPELSARQLLRWLCSIFALRQIERASGWLLAAGALAPEQIRALPRVVDAFCRELLPHAPELSEATGITNELLRIPIAEDDYVAAYDAKARHATIAA